MKTRKPYKRSKAGEARRIAAIRTPEVRRKFSLVKKGIDPVNRKDLYTPAINKKRAAALKGEKNYLWKGKKASYLSIHSWVTRWLGRPHNCESCGNTRLRHRQYHWANKSHEYRRELSDWIRLCVKCHYKYDHN